MQARALNTGGNDAAIKAFGSRIPSPTLCYSHCYLSRSGPPRSKAKCRRRMCCSAYRLASPAVFILHAGWRDQVAVCRLPSTVYRLLMARRLSITATDCK